MPICSRCHQEKEEVDFRIRREKNRTVRTFESYCKRCMRIYATIRTNKRKIKAIEYLGGKCKECGVIVHPAIFQFHHRDPSLKEASWNRKLRYFPWEKIKKELDKCDLLCGNCHLAKNIIAEYWPVC